MAPKWHPNVSQVASNMLFGVSRWGHMLPNDYEITSMTPARDPKQHFWKPLGKHLGGILEAFGSHLGRIWELEAEEASGRHLESRNVTPRKRNAKVPSNCQFYYRFLKVGIPK